MKASTKRAAATLLTAGAIATAVGFAVDFDSEGTQNTEGTQRNLTAGRNAAHNQAQLEAEAATQAAFGYFGDLQNQERANSQMLVGVWSRSHSALQEHASTIIPYDNGYIGIPAGDRRTIATSIADAAAAGELPEILDTDQMRYRTLSRLVDSLGPQLGHGDPEQKAAATAVIDAALRDPETYAREEASLAVAAIDDDLPAQELCHRIDPTRSANDWLVIIDEAILHNAKGPVQQERPAHEQERPLTQSSRTF